MKLSNNIKTVILAVLSTLVTLLGVKAYTKWTGGDVIFKTAEEKASDGMVSFANLPAGKPGDFTFAAEASAPSVVHIKAITTRQFSRRSNSIFEQFFGFEDMQPRQQNQESSGSGVIISDDGYIVTNNHVIEGTSSLEVITYNKKSYTAKVVGNDPSTDIAVIKIEAKNLPAITFGNSDEVKIGEWVLAVGNPFNLESTVTAGIISAIGRNINILGRSQQRNPFSREERANTAASPIESFIQTDAAVNPGNSGGALVNLNGHLIGINTAIASPNGSYAGYAFAVPSGIVKKVSADLIKYGDVQRGYVGIEPLELTNKNAKDLNVKLDQGIYVNNVPDNGAAKAAGVKKGDVILKADGVDMRSEAKFRELIGRKRPGEKVVLTIDRNGSVKDYTVTLRNNAGGEDLVKKDPETASAFGKMGMELQDLSASELKELNIRTGVRIKAIRENGLLSENTNFESGFIITSVGNQPVKAASEVRDIINKAYQGGEEGVLICGFYPGGGRGCEGIPIR
jgi:serine protease Do